MSSPIWKGQLAIGPLAFPVKLFTGARSESIHFNQIHQPCGSRVKQVLYCASEDKPIPRAEIVKGFEYEKEKFLTFDDADFAKPPEPHVMQIDQLVKPDQVDPIYFESSYYLAPDGAAEPEYATILNALKKARLWALSKITLSTRDRAILLRPGRTGIVVHALYFNDELHALNEFRTDHSQAIAAPPLFTYLRKHTAPFYPSTFEDRSRSATLKLIEARKKETVK